VAASVPDTPVVGVPTAVRRIWFRVKNKYGLRRVVSRSVLSSRTLEARVMVETRTCSNAAFAETEHCSYAVDVDMIEQYTVETNKT
jgi:hypothetical protein